MILGAGRFYEYQRNTSQQCRKFYSIYSDFFADIVCQNRGDESRRYTDLKAIFRAREYTRRIYKFARHKCRGVLWDDRIFQVAEIGRIHSKAARFLAKVLLDEAAIAAETKSLYA